jgi:hypothetical protein
MNSLASHSVRPYTEGRLALGPQLDKLPHMLTLSCRQATRLQSAIDRAHSELTAIDRRVDEIALEQLSEIEVDGAELRAQQLAELVVSGRERHGWFDDEISLSAEHAPPLSLMRQVVSERRAAGSGKILSTSWRAFLPLRISVRRRPLLNCMTSSSRETGSKPKSEGESYSR